MATTITTRNYNEGKRPPRTPKTDVPKDTSGPPPIRSEREIAMQDKIDDALNEMKDVKKRLDTRDTNTGLPLPSQWDLPSIRFRIWFESAPDYKFTKAKRYTVGPDGPHDIQPVPHIAYYPVAEPTKALKENKKGYEASKRLYEPLFDRFTPFVRDIDDLENLHPEAVENLIRNEGVFKPYDYNGAGLVDSKVQGYTGEKDKVKKVRAQLRMPMRKIFSHDPAAYDRFARIVGPRLNPKTQIFQFSCDYWNNSWANRDELLVQFRKIMRYSFGEEKWVEMAKNFERAEKESPDVKEYGDNLVEMWKTDFVTPVEGVKNLDMLAKEFIQKNYRMTRNMNLSRIRGGEDHVQLPEHLRTGKWERPRQGDFERKVNPNLPWPKDHPKFGQPTFDLGKTTNKDYQSVIPDEEVIKKAAAKKKEAASK